MTTLSGISSSQLSSIFQLNQTSSVNQVSSQSDTDSVQGNRPPGPPPGGGMADAIMQALSDIGVTGSSATGTSSAASSDSSSSSSSSSSSTTSGDAQSIAQALGSFMHSLFDALRSQNGQGDSTSGTQDSSTSSVAQAQGAGRPNIGADMQSLIQQLSSSSSSGTSSDTGSSTQSSLQQSFSNLMSALGDSNSNATLSNFLQALQSHLPGASTSGNVVNTQA